MPIRKLSDKCVNEYKNLLKTYLVTTRFNIKTWNENQQFLKNGILHPSVKCIYPCADAINSMTRQTTMFVLEMNNDNNKIIGIGFINNIPICNKYNVYQDTKHNTFAYLGKYRIDRTEFNEEEEKMIILLDKFCFKSKRHQKRLIGIKCFPIDILFEYRESTGIDFVAIITQMFKIRFTK
jgi:hypothetical protein